MTELPERIRVPLAELRHSFSRYFRLVEDGVIIDITKFGNNTVSIISVEDLRRMEALRELLSQRVQDAIAQEEANARASNNERKAKEEELAAFTVENKEIGKLMILAVQQLFDGNPKLLHDMAAKYLEL